MTVPSFVNNGATTTTGSGTSLSPALPGSRTNNNILIAIIAVNASGKTFSVGGGWTVDQTVNTSNHSIARVSRLVDGAEAAPTISWTGNAAANAYIVQLTGNDTSTIYGASTSAQGNSGSDITSATLTTTADNSLVCHIVTESTSVVIAEPTPNYTKSAGFTNTNISHAFFTGTAFVSGSSSDAILIPSSVGNWDSIAFELLGSGSAAAGEPAERATGVVLEVLLEADADTNLRASGVVLQVLRTVEDAPATDIRNKAMLLLRCGG